MKRGLKSVLAMLLVVVVVGNTIPIRASERFLNIDKKVRDSFQVSLEEKVSNRLMKTMEEVDNRTDKIQVCIWYEDVDHQRIEKELETETGLSTSMLDTDLSMPSGELLNDFREIASGKNMDNESIQNVQKNMEVYLEKTKEKRRYEREITNKYANKRREKYRKFIAEKCKEVLKSRVIQDENIVYKSSYAPMLVAKLTVDEIKRIVRDDKIVSIDEFFDMSIPSEEPIGNSLVLMKQYNQMEDIYTDTGLSGTGVKIGMIENGVPNLATNGVDEFDDSNSSKIENVGIHPQITDHANNTANILAGKNSLSFNIEKVYCASIQDTGYTNAAIGFCRGIENLVAKQVSVINASTILCGRPYDEDGETTWYYPIEKWLDYITYTHNITYVQAAGNNGAGTALIVPAMSYNIITVGGYDDANTASIEDDFLFHHNYESGEGCQKPDILAPKNFLGGGTCSATAIVSSMISLLLELKPSLAASPQQIKAILLASCHRKVLESVLRGDDTIYRYTESMEQGLTEKQGAGVVDLYTAICIVGNKQYGQIELGEDVQQVHVVQPKYDSTNMNVSIAWFHQNVNVANDYYPFHTDQQDNNVAEGVIHDVDLDVYKNLTYHIVGSAKENSSTEMVYFPITDNLNCYTFEISRYNPNSQPVAVGYAWSTNSMKYQTPTYEGIYYIKNKKNGKALDADENSYVFQNDFNGNVSQQWLITRESSYERYRISNGVKSGYIGLDENDGIRNVKLTTSGYSDLTFAEQADTSFLVRIFLPNDYGYTFQPTDCLLQVGTKMEWTTAGEESDSQKWYFSPVKYRKGDVNMDGLINQSDMSSLQNYVNNTISYTSFQKYLADVNGDGFINEQDIASLSQ